MFTKLERNIDNPVSCFIISGDEPETTEEQVSADEE